MIRSQCRAETRFKYLTPIKTKFKVNIVYSNRANPFVSV